MKKTPMTMRKLITKKPKAQRVSRVEVLPAVPDGFRTLAALFLEDFGIQISEGEWAEGDCHENLPVIDAAKLNSFENNLCYANASNPVTGLERGCVESGDNYYFVIYNPATVNGVSSAIYFEVLLTKSDAGYYFKRAGVEDSPDDSVPSEEGYRTLADLFLEDFGIQLTKTEGQWENGEFWEKQDVVDTALLDVWQEGLYFFCDADGIMQPPQQNSAMMLRKRSRLATQDPAWLGPYVAVCYDGPDEGGSHLFLIVNSMSESSTYVPLIKSEEWFLFKRVPQEESEPEPEYMPEPEPTPEPVPSEPEPPAPVSVALPTLEPTPEPVVVIPAKSALEEVYTTLTAQKLCTIVGLRTLLAKEQGISIKEAKSRITAVFKAVSDISALSGKSSLYGLGVFRQQKVKARTVVSHLGFGTYKLPRSSKFVFKPGKILKAKMAMCTGKTTAQIITTLQNLDTIKAAKSTVRKATRKKAIKRSGKSGM